MFWCFFIFIFLNNVASTLPSYLLKVHITFYCQAYCVVTVFHRLWIIVAWKKTADISRPYIWFPHKMASEKRAQKLLTNDVLLLRSGQCFWLVEASFPRGTTNQKHSPDLGSDTSSVWNFWSRSSDVISRETSLGRDKCRLFSQASIFVVPLSFL